MVGQEKLLSQFKELINQKRLPHFIILCGKLGMGKHCLINTLANDLCMEQTIISNSIDSIRGLISTAYNNLLDTFYVIENCDTMSDNAKNALLKLCEETPRTAYIIMLVENLDNILDTLKSRAQIYNLISYSKNELQEFMTLNNIMDNNILDVAICPGDILRLQEENNKNLFIYTKKVVDNLGRVSISNGLKIVKTINTNKTSTNGYDCDLFLNSLENACKQKYIETKDNRFIKFADIILDSKKALSRVSVNKLYELDNIIIKGWLLWNCHS